MGDLEFRALVTEWINAREQALMLGNRWPALRGQKRAAALNTAYDAKRKASDLEELVRIELGLWDDDLEIPTPENPE